MSCFVVEPQPVHCAYCSSSLACDSRFFQLCLTMPAKALREQDTVWKVQEAPVRQVRCAMSHMQVLHAADKHCICEGHADLVARERHVCGALERECLADAVPARWEGRQPLLLGSCKFRRNCVDPAAAKQRDSVAILSFFVLNFLREILVSLRWPWPLFPIHSRLSSRGM